MKAWEAAGICLAVAIGSAVGAALILKDQINRYLACEDEITHPTDAPLFPLPQMQEFGGINGSVPR